VRGLALAELAGAPAHALAVVTDDGDRLDYGDLRRLVGQGRELIGGAGPVLLCRLRRDLPGLVAYLAALELGGCVLLAENTAPETIAGLVRAYRPDLVVDTTGEPPPLDGHRVRHADLAGGRVTLMAPEAPDAGPPPHPETGLLMRTSGSLGSPKLVRLGYRAVAANAIAIGQALGLTAEDRGATTLPVDYSFGLSMVNSHLAAGASLLLSERSPTSASFWPRAAAAGVTEFGGVPATYRLLRAQRWQAGRHPHLRLLYQAGGALDEETIRYFGTELANAGAEFIVMYGQTEATARIACLDPARTLSAIGSVGRAIPGGRLWIEDPERPGEPLPDGMTGEVVYAGPNVMQGYATSRADLARGDDCGGVLRTGDLGVLRDGLLYLRGRRDRDVKILGRRINLDEFETSLSAGDTELAAVAGAARDTVTVFYTGAYDPIDGRRRTASARLGLPTSAIALVGIDVLPRNRGGKVDYAALRRRAGQD